VLSDCLSLRPSGRTLSVGLSSVYTCFAWRDISVLSGEIWMEHGRNIPHMSRYYWKCFRLGRGQRLADPEPAWEPILSIPKFQTNKNGTRVVQSWHFFCLAETFLVAKTVKNRWPLTDGEGADCSSQEPHPCRGFRPQPSALRASVCSHADLSPAAATFPWEWPV